VLGTIAGDDTIFVAPAQERRARAAAERLAELFGLPGAVAAERLG
jgi:transcriptional regulator of arginine metabolism